MLSFDIFSVQSEAVRVDDDLAADDPVWGDEDVRPTGPVHVTGRLSATGSGQFYFSGHLDGHVAGECRRCLTDVDDDVAADVHILFAEPGAEGAEDPDVFPVDVRMQKIDLRPAIREEWLLAAPAFPLCREDCKGICPTCGADRNAADCGCSTASVDPRWDKLRSLRPNE